MKLGMKNFYRKWLKSYQGISILIWLNTVKILKFPTPKKFAVITLKVEQDGFFLRVMHLKDAEGIANSVDPDQEQSDLGLHCLLRPVCPKT